MATSAMTLDRQINNYLEKLNVRQKKAVLAVAKTFAEEQVTNDYSDAFKAELDSRYQAYKNGEQLISEEDVDKHIDSIINSKTEDEL